MSILNRLYSSHAIINLPNLTSSLIMDRITEAGTGMSNRVYIFDTTLRDGEQSPGCSMNMPEKLRMAAKLVELGVDILEAGFPIASEGDFEAVDAVSRRVSVGTGCGPCAVLHAGCRARREVVEKSPPPAHPHLYRYERHSPQVQVEEIRQQVLDEAVAAVELARRHVDDVEFSAEDATRTDPDYLEQVSQGGGRGRRADGQSSGYGWILGT